MTKRFYNYLFKTGKIKIDFLAFVDNIPEMDDDTPGPIPKELEIFFIFANKPYSHTI